MLRLSIRPYLLGTTGLWLNQSNNRSVYKIHMDRVTRWRQLGRGITG